MADQPTRPVARGDEADLFRDHNEHLMRAVAGAVIESTPAVVEDACAFAWAQFIEYQPDRDRNWRGWLFRTAQREAWKLERQAQEHWPLLSWDGGIGGTDDGPSRDDHEVRTEVNDALSIVAQLPPRLQRIAMLRALGLSYQEIGQVTGDSQTRVGQLVGRANLEIYEILAERSHRENGASPRADRLWELEHEQPKWLVEKIGSFPTASRRSVAQSSCRRAWRRAALALDDFRDRIGSERFDEGLAGAPQDAELRRPHEAARRALDELAHKRTRERGRQIGD